MKTTLIFLMLILGTTSIRRNPETGEFFDEDPKIIVFHEHFFLFTKAPTTTPTSRPIIEQDIELISYSNVVLPYVPEEKGEVGPQGPFLKILFN
jgi:hypothetical protein